MHRMGLLRGFEFNEHKIIDEQVGTKSFIKRDVTEDKTDRLLPLHFASAFFQLLCEHNLVNRFQ